MISSKNIEKKRIFKTKNLKEDSDEASVEEDIYSDVANNTESKGTFKHFPRKSFVQIESEPLITNKSVLPPSLI